MVRMFASIFVVWVLYTLGIVTATMAVAVWVLLWGLLDLTRGTRFQWVLPYGAATVLLLVHHACT